MVWFLALALGPVTAPTPGPTPPPTPPAVLELAWTAPRQCPAGPDVEAKVIDTLGETETAERRFVRADATITQGDTGQFTLTLHTDDGQDVGRRTLAGPSCPELADAAALIIAITIDPTLVPPAPPPAPDPKPEPEREPEPDPDPDPDPVPPPAPVPVPDPPPPRAIALRPYAGPAFGPVPTLTAVVGLGLAATGRLWRAELSGSYWTPTREDSSTNPDVGVRVQLWNVGARGCGVPAMRTVEFPICGGIEIGAAHARGTGDLQPAGARSLWLAAVAGPGVLWMIRPFVGLALRAEAVITAIRPDFRTEPSGRVFRSRIGGLAVTAGVEFRIPVPRRSAR